MTGTCDHCGSRVPADALKCPACGSSTFKDPTAASPSSSGAVKAAGVGFVAVAVGLLAVVGGLVALGVVAFLLLEPSGPPSSPPPVSAAQATATDGFAGVRAHGRFVVAADPHAPPFLSGTANSYQGFEYALMAAIADAAGAPLEIRPTAYASLLDTVAAGGADPVDAAIGQLPPDPHPGVVYTRSYLQYNLCLTVRPDGGVHGLADLRGKTIGMYDDETAKGVVQAALGSAWTAKTYGDYGYFRDLTDGRIDAVVYDCPLTRYELAKDGAKLTVADARLGVATYSIAVPADHPALRADIDKVLGELGGNGLLQQLSTRWLGETPAVDAPSARITVVRSGETLDQVAARALGDAARSKDLLEWNRDILGSDPGAVYAGMQLRIR